MCSSDLFLQAASVSRSSYHISIMKKDMTNIPGLNSNYINCITQDDNGYVILGTNNSLLAFTGSQFIKIPMFDTKGRQFTTYVNQVYTLRNKDIAVATSGYGILIKKLDAQECHTLKGDVEKLKYIRKLLEDKVF